ncbi:MAG: hypothetical protein NVSMB39_6720 [Candidatus Saccharimonadales bacterium]
MTPRTKKILIISAIVLIVVIALITIISGAQKAVLTVTASDPQALISVTSRTDLKLKLKDTQGRLSQKVPVGEYIVKAATKNAIVTQAVTVKSGSEVKVTLTFQKIFPLEMVTKVSAASLVADAGNLQFINTDTSSLTRLTSQNQIIPVNNFSFSNIKWADPSYGIGLSASGQLYIIDNLNPTQFNLPFTPASHTTAAIAADKSVYVSDGSIVYLYSGGKFSKIYSTNKALRLLSASNTAVIGIEDPAPTTGQKADEGRIILISRSGSVKRTDGEAYDAAWSPSGEKVIVNGDEQTAVLDKNLKRLSYFPHSNANSPVWLDNDTVAYGFGNSIWRFDVGTGTSQQLATDSSLTFTQLYAASDSSYLYATTQSYKDGKNQTVRRVPLKGQTVTPASTILGLILPSTIGQCRLSYVNFAAPTVSVQGPKAQQATCTASAQKYLQTYHVPTTGLGLSFSAL